MVAASAYGLSAVVLSAFSDGRIALLAALIVLPALVERLEVAFGSAEPPDGRWRFIAGLAVTIAVEVAFVPGVLLAIGVVAIAQLVAGSRRARGLPIVALSAVGAAVLLFPFVPALVAGHGASLGSELGSSDPWHLVRLAFEDGPATWAPALFLPVAAALGLALASGDRRAPALRAGVIAIAGLVLAWLSAAGYLPTQVANTPVYVSLTATAEAFLVAFGLASAIGGLGRAAFGFRQVGTALLTLTLAGGILLQAIAAMTAQWAIGGPDRIPAAWAFVRLFLERARSVSCGSAPTMVARSRRPGAIPRAWSTRGVRRSGTGSPRASARSRSIPRDPSSGRAATRCAKPWVRSCRGRRSTGCAPRSLRRALPGRERRPAHRCRPGEA